MRYRVLDTPVDGVDMTGALAYVAEAVRNGDRPAFILAVNPEKVFVLRQDAFLRDFFEQAGTADSGRNRHGERAENSARSHHYPGSRSRSDAEYLPGSTGARL